MESLTTIWYYNTSVQKWIRSKDVATSLAPVKLAELPPGLSSITDEIAYGWVTSRHHFVKTGGQRMFNNQLLLKNVTACSRYEAPCQKA